MENFRNNLSRRHLFCKYLWCNYGVKSENQHDNMDFSQSTENSHLVKLGMCYGQKYAYLWSYSLRIYKYVITLPNTNIFQ